MKQYEGGACFCAPFVDGCWDVDQCCFSIVETLESVFIFIFSILILGKKKIKFFCSLRARFTKQGKLT